MTVKCVSAAQAAPEECVTLFEGKAREEQASRAHFGWWLPMVVGSQFCC